MNEPNDSITTTALLDCWRHCAIAPVWPDPDVHALHCYFNTCPESPDGRWVLLFVSSRPDAQVGDLCLIERKTGERIVLHAGIEVEDAHRQANQQWVCNGDFVVAMAYRDAQWQVLRLDPVSRECVVLCTDRQVFLSNPRLDEVPL